METAEGSEIDSPSHNTTLSVVITTYNRSASAVTAVSAVLEDPAVSEVVIVDDGSGDDTVASLQRMAADHDRLIVVPLNKNGGRTEARQLGVETATADVVLLLDDDVIAGPGLGAGHLAHHRERDDLVVIGYMPVAKASMASVTSRLYANEYEGAINAYRADSRAVLDKLWGGNVSLRRTNALAVGLTNEHMHDSFHEDLDFGRRCRNAGLTGLFDEQLRAEHRHSRTVEGFVKDAYNRGVSIAKLDDSDLNSVVVPPFALLAHPLVVGALTRLLQPLSLLGARAELIAVKTRRRLALYRGAADHREGTS